MQAIKHKAGDRVTIINQTLSGKDFIEGEAILTQFMGKADYPPYPETWRVRFLNEGGQEYQRNIVE